MKVDQLINKGVALVLAAMAASAGATEGGTSMYPAGSEAYTCVLASTGHLRNALLPELPSQ